VLHAVAGAVAGHVQEQAQACRVLMEARALAARLFTAGLYGLMAQWHLAPGSFSWETAAAALADGPAAVPHSASLVFDGEARPSPSPANTTASPASRQDTRRG